jgi:hypothetical protein
MRKYLIILIILASFYGFSQDKLFLDYTGDTITEQQFLNRTANYENLSIKLNSLEYYRVVKREIKDTLENWDKIRVQLNQRLKTDIKGNDYVYINYSTGEHPGYLVKSKPSLKRFKRY